MASSENDGDTVQIVINSLKAAGVKVVFGIPGAKIDSLFNALYDEESIRLVVCRHEQNAAFMAGVVGKLTNVPGVCIVTSGPGTSNLPTGLITATDEGMMNAFSISVTYNLGLNPDMYTRKKDLQWWPSLAR